MSSLAGLAFLASGSTPTRGPYARHLQGITEYLLAQCTGGPTPGLISNPRAWEERTHYCHAFALTYLSQVFGQERDATRRERIRRVLRAGVELTGRTQSDWGGWGYYPNHYEDEGTLTVTQLQGLRSCRDVGIFVPREIIDGAIRYIEVSTREDGGVRYMARGSRYDEVRPGTTCAAIVTLWQAGRYDDPLLHRIRDYMDRYLVPRATWYWESGHHGEYILYYMAQAKHVLGGSEWRDFYRTVSTMLAVTQEADGSWDGGRDTGRFGDVFGTTMALLILQLPYNRLPVYQR